jgi:hypothetical protein
LSRLSRDAVRWLVAAGLACLLIAALTIASAGAAEFGAEGDHLVVSDVANLSSAQAVTLIRFNGLGASDGSNCQQLESLMRGTIKNWDKLQTATGAGCTGAPITRVVRAEGSGTTYQFKYFLQQINAASIPCVEGSRNRKQLEEIGPTGEPNTVWPRNGVAGCAGATVSPLVTAAGGGAVVRTVNTTEGSFGYAALPDIEANKANGENAQGDTNWLRLQNNGVSDKLAIATMVGPAEEGNDSAACASTPYYVPVSGVPPRPTRPTPTGRTCLARTRTWQVPPATRAPTRCAR